MRIPDDWASALDAYCDAEDVSRAEAIRRAIDNMLETDRRQQALERSFGAWRGRGRGRTKDALEAIDELRAEWDE